MSLDLGSLFGGGGDDDDVDSITTSTQSSSSRSSSSASSTTRGGFFGGLFGPDPTSTTASATRTQGGGLLDTLLGIPPATSQPTPTSSAGASLTTSAPQPSPPTLTESSTLSVFESSSDGRIITVTAFVPASTDGANSTNVNANDRPQPKSFLENKALSGFVFALCGLVGLILIVMIATCALRRKQRKKLLNEAISFDPSNLAVDPYSPSKDERIVGLERSNSMEKRMSISSTGHGHDAHSGPSSHGHSNYAAPALTYSSPPMAQQPQYHQSAYVEHQTTYPEHQGYYGQEQDQYYGGQAQQGWYDQGQYAPYNNYGQPPMSAASAVTSFAPVAAPPVTSRTPLPTLPHLNFIGASPPTGHAGVLHSPMLADARRVSSLLALGHAPSTPTSSISRSATVATSAPYSDALATPTVTVTKSNSLSSAKATPGDISPTKHGRSHSRELDSAMPALPLSPMLPETFGQSEEDEKQRRGSVVGDDRYLATRGVLKSLPQQPQAQQAALPVTSRLATTPPPPSTPRISTSLPLTVTPTSPLSNAPTVVAAAVSMRTGIGPTTITTLIPAPQSTAEPKPLVSTRTGAQAQGFLDNKPLSGFVFVLSGLFGLVVITMIATCMMRRRQRKKMMDEAMLFDSASMINNPYSHNGAAEKGRGGLSRSNSGRSSRKRLSDESFGYVAQGHPSARMDGGADTYGLPTLAYAPPSTTYSPQYPQMAHAEPRQKSFGEREYYTGQDRSQPLW
ncbi:hypothetical protein ONZ45_g6659 [Pleurotus djamor]|nr:hypothetical protein ONZ45_g6659 [Pleurotus djamor]